MQTSFATVKNKNNNNNNNNIKKSHLRLLP